MLQTIFSLIAVGFLWGVSTPLLRRGSQGIEKVQTGSSWRNVLSELSLISKRLHYWVPFLINQTGSVLFVWTLQSCPMSVAVPIANSLNFVFMTLMGRYLGEPSPGKAIYIGSTLICLGSALMIYEDVNKK